MTMEFPKLVGAFIHHCGALEFLTNSAIRAFASDDVLSANVVKAPLARRIDVLRALLAQRSALGPAEVASLCDDLNRVRTRRNLVAHNPIVRTDADNEGTESILIVRHKPEGSPDSEELSVHDLRTLVNESRELMERFAELVPEALTSS